MEHWRGLWRVPILEVHDSLPSTNDRARALAEVGSPRFSTVIAEEQTAGRGRAGRSWASKAEAGLWMSILASDSAATGAMLTPLLVGLAVVRALNLVAPELDPGLKWPNDVLVRERKVCGILCEAAGVGAAIVAGVGMNIRQRSPDFPGDVVDCAISVEAATGRPISRPALAEAVLTNVMALVEHTTLTGSLADELANADVLVGRTVQIDPGPRGVARGIGPTGALLVDDGQGRVKEVWGGHVTLVVQAPAVEEDGKKNGA